MTRILGTGLLFFLLIVLVGGLAGDSSEAAVRTIERSRLFMLLYPLTTIFGLLLAYWRPLWGGLIATAGLLATVMMEPAWLQGTFWWMLIPGVLYVFHGLDVLRQARLGNG